MLAPFLDHFRVGHLVITFRIEKGGTLPPYKGSAFRGAFGHALKITGCPRHGMGREDTCEETKCLYKQIFESSATSSGSSSHPYVIKSKNRETEFQVGDFLTFEMVSLGFLNKHLSLLIETFRLIRGIGMGSSKVGVSLYTVEAITDEGNGTVLFKDDYQYIYALPLTSISLRTVPNEIVVEYLTPIRLLHKGSLQRELDFPLLLKAVNIRTNEIIQRFYPELNWNLNLEKVGKVDKEYDALTMKRIYRYSNRQEKKMWMDGLVGLQKYSGEGITDAFPLLKLAELVHVGKSSSMGFGQIKIWT